MQTFLPYPDFYASAQTLDRLRLGKQRVEAQQIYHVLKGFSNGWLNHPAVLMWSGYENALCKYLELCILEWKDRGYKNTIVVPKYGEVVMPWWFGNNDFHASHRSNLLRKNPDYYSRYNWTEPNDLPYLWPVRKA